MKPRYPEATLACPHRGGALTGANRIRNESGVIGTVSKPIKALQK